MKIVNKDTSIKFKNYMLRKYGAKMVDKNSAEEMKYISRIVASFSSISKESFLKDYTTTLYNRIYIPFEYGTRKPMSEIALTLHEIQHVVDFTTNPVSMAEYLFSKSARANLEMKALLTAVELNWWAYGKFPNVKRLAEHVRPYGLRDNDVEYIRKSLLSYREMIRKGKIISSVGKNGIMWLNRNTEN